MSDTTPQAGSDRLRDLLDRRNALSAAARAMFLEDIPEDVGDELFEVVLLRLNTLPEPVQQRFWNRVAKVPKSPIRAFMETLEKLLENREFKKRGTQFFKPVAGLNAPGYPDVGTVWGRTPDEMNRLGEMCQDMVARGGAKRDHERNRQPLPRSVAIRKAARRLKASGMAWPDIAERIWQEHPEWFPNDASFKALKAKPRQKAELLTRLSERIRVLCNYNSHKRNRNKTRRRN
jgi:hypothetical protein